MPFLLLPKTDLITPGGGNVMRAIQLFSLISITIIIIGCGGNGDGNGNGPEPTPEPRLVASVSQDPGLASVNSSIWDGIAPESVYVGTDNDYNANVLFRTDFVAELKALRTDTLIYVRATWSDADQDNRFGALMGTWVIDNVRWSLNYPDDTMARNEDRIYFLFDRGGTGGADCSQMCHTSASSAGRLFYGAAGDNADIWQWKANRTGLAGLAEDMHLSDTMITADPQVNPYDDNLYFLNWNSFTEKPIYMHHNGPDYEGAGLLQTETPSGAFTPFVNSSDWIVFVDGVPTESKQVPGYYILDSTGTDGSRWNIETISEFDGSHWTVIFRRKLIPDDPVNDINFSSYIGDSLPIAIGITDNSGIKHHGTKPFYLVLP